MERKNALFDEILFPGGKPKAFTMSYDDGTIHDRRLVAMMNKHNIKGTFNLNSGFLGVENIMSGPRGTLDISRIDAEEVATLYEGHEVAGHSLYHASPINVGSSAYVYETVVDKVNLEKLVDGVVRGYAYPFGLYDEDVKKMLTYSGYHYARVVDTTGAFGLPTDYMEWKGTCHHNDGKLMELAENFCKDDFFTMHKKLFYVWGHSYEFEGDKNWDMMETFLAYMEEHGENIWFATNIEIYDYCTAYKKLEYTADASKVYNPSALTVWFKREGQVYKVEPLQTLTIWE